MKFTLSWVQFEYRIQMRKLGTMTFTHEVQALLEVLQSWLISIL